MDKITKASELAGSVNTVTNKDGVLIGDTTDGVGYLNSLLDSGFDYHGKKMTLLGAGGAATSIAVSAALSGVKRIDIFKRRNATFEETEAFAEKINASTDCDILVFPMDDAEAMKAKLEEAGAEVELK